MSNPLVSICLPTYNGVEFLSDCIKSILNQNYKSWELLVVNDGSTDSTQDIIDYYSKLDKRIKGITIEHSGISVARQTALDNAKGEYIAVMDTDCQMSPERLEEELEMLKKDKSDVCYSGYIMVFQNGTMSNITSESISDKTTEDILDRKYPNSNQIIPNFTILAKKECFKGVYRPEFKVNDDLDMVCIWLDRKYKFSFIDHPLVMHFESGYNVSSSKYDEVLEITEKLRKERGI